MVYNFGAALTVLLIEFWLLRQMGVRNTVLAMATLNGVVALALRFGFREWRETPPAIESLQPVPSRHLLSLAVASVGSAVFQLLMVKIAECFLGPFRETFAIVLALVLLGIAVGSALVRRWQVSFTTVLLVGLAGLAWLVGGFELVTRGYAWVHPAAAEHGLTAMLHKVTALALLMAVPAMAFGATIPALLGELGNVARDSGKLLCISSLANALGFLLMASVLHRFLDYGVLVIVVAAFIGLSVLIHGRFRGRLAAMAAGLVGAVVVLQQVRWDENLLYLGYYHFHSSDELSYARRKMLFPERFKGAQDVFSLNRWGEDIHFFVNGYVSHRVNSPAEKIVGAFPPLFAARTDRALVLGVGSGATAGTLACLVDRTDAVEINPVILKNVHRMAEHNFDIVSKPQVKLFVDDGIHFMKVGRERYPLIVNTVTSPRYFSSAKLYTRDFLSTVRQRLTPDGIYVTWVDTGIGPRGLDIIFKTVTNSFAHCALAGIKSGYFLLLCSDEPVRLRQPQLLVSHGVLSNYFKLNGLPPELLPYGLLCTRVSDLIGDPRAPLNTMDRPALEFEMARLDDRDADDFLTRLRDNLNLADVAQALQPALAFRLADMAVLSDRLYKDSVLSERRRELAGLASEDFREEYLKAKLDYHATLAALANTAEAHHEHGAELLLQRRFEEAIQAEQKALALNSQVDDAWFNIAFCQERTGQPQAAITNSLNERRIDPIDNRIALSLGRTYFRMNQHTQALEQLQRALVENDTAETRLVLSRVLKALGRPAEAEAEYQRALQFGLQPAKPSATAKPQGAR